MKMRLLSFLSFSFVIIMVMAFMPSTEQNAPWPVPDNYKAMKNPVKYDKTPPARRLHVNHTEHPEQKIKPELAGRFTLRNRAKRCLQL